jgi:hypothetical protein
LRDKKINSKGEEKGYEKRGLKEKDAQGKEKIYISLKAGKEYTQNTQKLVIKINLDAIDICKTKYSRRSNMTKLISVRMDVRDIERLKKEAKELRLTLSSFIKLKIFSREVINHEQH